MKTSPTLTSLASYPFVALNEAKERLSAAGTPIIDFGVGEPREVTPEFIREALKSGIEPVSSYPLAPGLPELRAAINEWIERRFSVQLNPDSEIIPTFGSKEAIFHLPQVVAGETVVVTTPGYPVPERGAVFAGKKVHRLPLLEKNHFLPDLGSIGAEVWEQTAVLWLNYPNNPTAATATLELYEQAAQLAREYDFIFGSDEAYSELYFGADPPVSALQVSDRTNVAVFNTLSKRSSMPGYRCAFVAGEPDLIAAMKAYRPNVGLAPPQFIQRAGVAAWEDEKHVEDVRDLYRAKRDLLLPVLERHGLHHVGGDATFFLWLKGDCDTEALAARLLEHGVVLSPGSFFGEAGIGYLRLALVPTLVECERAAALLNRLL